MYSECSKLSEEWFWTSCKALCTPSLEALAALLFVFLICKQPASRQLQWKKIRDEKCLHCAVHLCNSKMCQDPNPLCAGSKYVEFAHPWWQQRPQLSLIKLECSCAVKLRDAESLCLRENHSSLGSLLRLPKKHRRT